MSNPQTPHETMTPIRLTVTGAANVAAIMDALQEKGWKVSPFPLAASPSPAQETMALATRLHEHAQTSHAYATGLYPDIIEAIVADVRRASEQLAASPSQAHSTHGYGCPSDGDPMVAGENCVHCCRHGWVESAQGKPCPECYPAPSERGTGETAEKVQDDIRKAVYIATGVQLDERQCRAVAKWADQRLTQERQRAEKAEAEVARLDQRRRELETANHEIAEDAQSWHDNYDSANLARRKAEAEVGALRKLKADLYTERARLATEKAQLEAENKRLTTELADANYWRERWASEHASLAIRNNENWQCANKAKADLAAKQQEVRQAFVAGWDAQRKNQGDSTNPLIDAWERYQQQHQPTQEPK